MGDMNWKTADGRIIPISKMTDSHLLNAHRYIRKGELCLDEMREAEFHPVFGPRGDGATWAFEQELEELEMFVISAGPYKEAMSEEIEKRGLKPLSLPDKRKLPEFELVEDMGNAQIFKRK